MTLIVLGFVDGNIGSLLDLCQRPMAQLAMWNSFHTSL